MTDTRIIKKYPNRRLYDTAISSYVTLTELKDLALAQTPFRVIDVKSNADITRQTLLQIIQDQEERGTQLFSTEFLLHAVRCYDVDVQPATSRVLEQALKVLADKEWLQEGEGNASSHPFAAFVNNDSENEMDNGSTIFA